MTQTLRVTLGQHSRGGVHGVNQDFHGAMLPHEPLRSRKGIAVALADGIGSSPVSQEASAAAVRSFLEDYYATSDAWSVRRSAQRVLGATNAWLHAQTMRSHARFDLSALMRRMADDAARTHDQGAVAHADQFQHFRRHQHDGRSRGQQHAAHAPLVQLAGRIEAVRRL